MAKHNSETIATALRKRICLEPPTASLVLHEQELAVEFGVSRTPVRQALQRLAYERLVEVRSGVGTVVSALDPALKDRDISLALALVRVASDIEGDRSMSVDAKMMITALERQVSTSTSLDLDTNFTIRSKILDIITGEMSSDILASALKAALWRLFRWRMAEAVAAQSGIDERLPEVLASMSAATQVGTVGALLEAQLHPGAQG